MEEDLRHYTMSVDTLLRDTLYIPSHLQRPISDTRVICLVDTDWLLSLRQKSVKDGKWSQNISRDDAALYLSPSYKTLPKHLNRVCIKIVKKSSQPCKMLHNGPLTNTVPAVSCMEHLVQSARENFRNSWTSAHVNYSHVDMDMFQSAEQQFTNVMRSYLQRVNPQVYITIPGPQNVDGFHSNQGIYGCRNFGNNVIPVTAVIETASTFFIVQPFVTNSLCDLVRYSPAILDTSHAKSLFILYQVLQAMVSFHQTGLSVGKLNLHNVRVDDKLWVYCSSVQTSAFSTQNSGETSDSSASVININNSDEPSTEANQGQSEIFTKHVSESSGCSDISGGRHSGISECENYLDDALDVLESYQTIDVNVENLAKLTEDWVNHRINNFRYLMYLNYLAGRRLGDPNHHPVLPWVMDFTKSNSGLRNLSMSKFRLNKGDSQLDFTFEAMAELGDDEHIPHHVSDVLSDITYYVYKARRTQKHLLCAYVRTKWVPNEYPQSIERMYQWTPDECIPELFTDPTIFTSIHEDLPDLELPSWCSSAADFIERHMSMLESEQVSVNLHRWIDLTFGYKLSGSSAVKSKNVYLQLVDQHKNVTSQGVVQLFNHPHPHKLSFDKTLSLLPIRVRRTKSTDGKAVEKNLSLPEPERIKLPSDYDPTAALDHFEALHSFTCQTTESLPPSTVKTKEVTKRFSDFQDNMKIVWEDMQQFACLMCEVYLAPKLYTQGTGNTLPERYNIIGRLCAKNRNLLPRIVHTAAEILLKLDEFTEISDTLKRENGGNGLLFEYPMVNSLGLPPPTPSLLVQPFTNLLPFPPYFSDLYKLLNQMKIIDKEIEVETSDLTKAKEKKKIEKVLARKKVEVLEKYLKVNRGAISEEGYELLLPYIKELFSDPNTTVQAAWSLLGLIGKEIGPSELAKNLMPHLVKLFTGDGSTPKHMKLYHRSFLVQLLLNLGLETFLTHFSTLLVEAVAGYKNFNVNEDPDLSQDDIDDVDEVFNSNQSLQTDLKSMTELVKVKDVVQLEDDDIRPDQTEEEEAIDVGGDVDDDIDEFEEKFSGLGCHGNSLSTDSMSNDQISERSNGSDITQDEDSGLTDRGSSDRASIHSISHILDMSHDTSHDLETFDEDQTGSSNSKMKNSHSVHFEIDEKPEIELGTSVQSEDSSNFQTDQSDEGKNEDDQSNGLLRKSSSYMIRSETDEFRQISHSHTINVCDVAAESIKWLSNRLGPLLTAKYLSKNLIRMLALCYFGEEQVVVLEENDTGLMKSTRLVQGDRNAHKILECLTSVACIYGEQVILLQYIPCIIDLIHVARKRLTIRAEAGLVAAVVLLRHVIPLLCDKTFLDTLKESVIFDALKPTLRLVSSMTATFPSGSEVRSVILYKIIDVLYIIGLRLGFELTRRLMTDILQLFFKPFEHVYARGHLGTLPESGSSNDFGDMLNKDSTSTDESFLNIKMDQVTNQYKIGSPVSLSISPHPADFLKKWRTTKSSYSLADINLVDDRDETDSRPASEEILLSEFQQTYSPELALAAYIPLTSVFGSHHMEEYLTNDDLIRKLCAQYDKALYTENAEPEPIDIPGKGKKSTSKENGDIGSNVAIVGNRICIQADEEEEELIPDIQMSQQFQHKGILRIDPDDTRCDDLNHNKLRHLKGNWLAYWEHELGLNERDTLFNFKQIKLQTFTGHANSIRSITCLDNENSFISASKDKTVKLWSLHSFNDGSGKSRCQWSYEHHKKSVFSVAYLENLRLVASCDSTVHVWDPFTGDTLRKLESTQYSPVIALTPLSSPSTVVVTATQDCTLRFLDMRTARYAHEYKSIIGNHGLIRCITTSPDGTWVAVGFSSGVIAVLNLHTGLLLGSWKAHDSEILQLRAFSKNAFLSTSFDLNMKLWSVEGSNEICSFRGHTEPVHCVRFYKSQIVSATTNNKIGVHTSVDQQANFSSTKLRSEVFKGVLTSMEILPLNRTLLLGTDNGLIRLLC